VAQTGALPVPLHIRNAPTGLMKTLGYGRGYKYAHDYRDAVVSQSYLPDQLTGTRLYEPTDRGFEKTVKKRLDRWRRLKEDPHAEKDSQEFEP
jgi:putative ATPase